jgi:hypothetical protein
VTFVANADRVLPLSKALLSLQGEKKTAAYVLQRQTAEARTPEALNPFALPTVIVVERMTKCKRL